LHKYELDDCDNEPVDLEELGKGPKKPKDWWAERASTLSDLIDKLNKARNEEDLKSCLEVKSQLFNNQTESRLESGIAELLTEQTAT
ncbi:hypothetical protein OFM39_31540, partial [Escherichia coli]|nr:hypothetical protein [Escherichia coli]